MHKPTVVAIGAGVIGRLVIEALTRPTSSRDALVDGQNVIVLDRGDPRFMTSPNAAAFIYPDSTLSNRQAVWIPEGFKFYRRAVVDHWPGVQEREIHVLSRHPQRELLSFEAKLPGSRLLPGYLSGSWVESFSINPPVFLAGLKKILESRGVTFLTREVNSFGQVAEEFSPTVIINVTGIGAGKLAKDQTVRPYRGHCIRIQLDQEPDHVMNSADEDAWCVPVGAGECRIGTTFEPDCWDNTPDETAIEGILARVQDILPETCGKLDPERIISVSCAFRPGRDQGVRLEHEQYREQPDQLPVDIVHCYGHKGDGFGLGPGSALDVRALVQEILTRK